MLNLQHSNSSAISCVQAFRQSAQASGLDCDHNLSGDDISSERYRPFSFFEIYSEAYRKSSLGEGQAFKQDGCAAFHHRALCTLCTRRFSLVRDILTKSPTGIGLLPLLPNQSNGI